MKPKKYRMNHDEVGWPIFRYIVWNQHTQTNTNFRPYRKISQENE